MAKVPHYKQARIEIIYYCVQEMDFDNAYTSAKPLVDGLVEAMIIPDDSPKFIQLKVHCKKVKHRPEQRTEIIINQLQKENG